jgi:hypothetical protein
LRGILAPKATQTARKRAVITRGVLFDEEFTDTVLRLTDPTIQSRADVEELFRKIARGRPAVIANDGEQTNSREIGDETFDYFDWEVARHLLLRWCPKVSQYDRLSKSSRATLLADINKAGLAMGRVHLRVSPAGLMLATSGDDLTSAAFRAVLPFLEPTYGWPPRRLAKCQLNTCGRWFLRPNQSGTVAMYCSAKHSNLARVRRSRGTDQ